MAEPPQDGGPHNGEVKFAGMGFGSAVGLVKGEMPPPRSASARELMRMGLPVVYRQGDLALPFVAALERVLDPIVGLLDNLAYHFDHRYSPPDILDLLTGWLGLEHDERLAPDDRRALVSNAGRLVHRRGTRDGLELALTLAFPGIPLRVEDHGGVRTPHLPAKAPSGGSASFVVYCDRPIPDAQQAAIARVIERVKPAHAAYRLRVKAARQPKAESA